MEISKKRVASSRLERKGQPGPTLSPTEQETLVHRYHPDYKEEAYRAIRFGPNKGEKTVHELADLLESASPVDSVPDAKYVTDILVIGGGGAGATAALTAKGMGACVMIATKLRLGDANTVMAEGGMQVALSPDDTPVRHYLDTLRGGHMENDPALLKILVEEGPAAAKWLIDQGVMFDRDLDGHLSLRSGGGSSKPRLLRCKDYTGLEMMRVLKDSVLNAEIPILEYSPAVEFLTDEEGACTGVVLKNTDNQQPVVVSTKCVILATGGIGRLHIQGFPTSNHYGATGDGLPMAYRAGAQLTLQDTFQYHPTGAAFPEPIAGMLVTEALRSVGAQLINANGERFINEMQTRDVVASAVIKECVEGRGITTPAGRRGVWLDLPLVEMLHGAGTLGKRFPNMVRQFARYQIDISKEPVLVYPTLHYQNGGVKMDVHGESTVKNLFVAGEVSGGIHGRNRLMGNSLLDIIVYGRRVGKASAERAATLTFKKRTLGHLERFYKAQKEAGVAQKTVSPMLFPDYVQKD